MTPHFLNHRPSRLSRNVTFGLTLGLSLGNISGLHAASFTWDSNGATSGVLDGTGTWNTTGNWWNGTTNVNWTNGTAGTTDTTEAIFGSNNGTAGNVTASAVTLNKITFNPAGSGNYTLIGNSTVTLTGASGVGIYSNTSATISTYAIINTTADKTLNFVSNAGTLTVSFGRLTRNTASGAHTFALAGAGNGAWTTGINNPFSDVPISISKAGAGTWTLSGYNGYTGTTTISEGTLSVGMIGNPTGAVVKNTNTVWQYTTTLGSATVTVSGSSPSTTGLAPGQYFYSNATPNGAKILSVDSATQFTLESGTGVLAQANQPMAVFGEASNMGLASAAASNLVFNGTAGNGALKYTGTTKDTGRAFTINSGKVATIEVTNSGTNLTFVGATGASTTGALTKTGAGTLTLSGTNTYTGATTVSAGTLALGAGGSISNTTTISLTTVGATLDVSAASFTLGGTQTLKGIGSATGTVITGASTSTIAPGMSAGTLTLSALNAAGGGTFDFELGTTSDMLQITGLLTGSTNAGDFHFNFSDAGGIAASTPYTLFTFGSVTGLDYTDLEALTLPSGMTLDSGFGTGGWLIDSDNLQVQFVPEPRAALLGGLGILVLLRRRR